MNSLCNGGSGSVQPIYGPIFPLPWWPEVSWAHWALNNPPLLLPAQIQMSHFNCNSLTHLLIWFYLFQWPSSWVQTHLRDAVLQPEAVFCHNSATQKGLTLYYFHCCNHPRRIFATINDSLWSIGHSYSAMSKASLMALRATNWLNLPCLSAVSVACHVRLHTTAFYLWCFPAIRWPISE